MRAAVAILAGLALLVLAACGERPADRPPGPLPAPPRVSTEDLPPALAELRGEGNRLITGGPERFREQLAELRGHPVVVNKWASWCGPCRAEFPFFRSQAAKRARQVAFIGVNSQDDPDAAEAFLRRLPPGYPSYIDRDLEVAAVFKGVAAFPTTAFYDARGRLAYVKQGGYASERKLAEDIERYTR
ncbi:MAG: TlpA family protein disulfide reductase [Thermoleophilaceae bacterium]